jgi:hypothetical protein
VVGSFNIGVVYLGKCLTLPFPKEREKKNKKKILKANIRKTKIAFRAGVVCIFHEKKVSQFTHTHTHICKFYGMKLLTIF